MKPKQTLLLVITLLVSLTTSSQNKGDSLKVKWQNNAVPDSVRFKALNTYYLTHRYSKTDTTLLVTDYHFTLAKEKKSDEEMIWALSNKATVFRIQGKFDAAKQHYNQAKVIATELESPVLKATMDGNIGIVLSHQKNYQEATQYYASALKIFQEEKDSTGEVSMLNNLGGIYQVIGDDDMALAYYKNSFKIVQGRENKQEAILLMNIGTIQHKRGMHQEAMANFEKAFQISQFEEDPFYISECNRYLAKIHLSLGQLEVAKAYGEKSLEINTSMNQESGIIVSLLVLAQITFETNSSEATKKAEAILDRLPSVSSKNIKRDAYKLLYQCYKAQNKSGLSLKMYELHTKYSDSIQVETDKFTIIREGVKKDFEVQLYQAELENEKAQTALKLKQLKTNFGIIAGAILLISCILLYFRRNTVKNKKKRDALLEEIEHLKDKGNSKLVVDANTFELNRISIESSIERKLNDTDWKVLEILLQNPEITNKDIAQKAFLSVDGIGSSLRRMYTYFNIKETKYKKISLLSNAIQRSTMS